MNILDDDRKKYNLGGEGREQYVLGGITSAIGKAVSKKLPKSKIKKSKNNQTASTEEKAERLRQMSDAVTKLKQRGFSDDRIEEIIEEAYELGEPSDLIIALKKPIVREQKAEGGSLLSDDMPMDMPMEEQETPMMPEVMPEMDSDSDMEENYTRFIMDEALSEEEEDMLVSKLEQDEELQMLFDKVIDVAQEFAGSGPIEGPGTGVSDDIPARLSDGEFVFTAKAVEEIGEDVLMSMMKEAEASVDGRQELNEGGTTMLEQPEVDQFGKPVDADIVEDDIRKSMLSVNPRLR